LIEVLREVKGGKPLAHGHDSFARETVKALAHDIFAAKLKVS
jgi:hypothetical protein